MKEADGNNQDHETDTPVLRDYILLPPTIGKMVFSNVELSSFDIFHFYFGLRYPNVEKSNNKKYDTRRRIAYVGFETH